MKHKNTLFCLILALTLSLLAGCGDSASTPQEDAAPGEQIEEPAQQPAGGEEEFDLLLLSDRTFWFGSGAGAWCTEVVIAADGSFTGEYHDSDMGSAGGEYPNGTVYWCSFSGTLSKPVKVNDYTYSMTVETLEQEGTSGTEEIRDGIRWICSDPYGFDDVEELLLYLPGAPVEELPEEYMSWARGYGDITGTELPFYGLYNVNAQEGFSSYQREA